MGSVPSLSILWNGLKSIGIKSSLKVGWNSVLNPSWAFCGMETINDCFYFFRDYGTV